MISRRLTVLVFAALALAGLTACEQTQQLADSTGKFTADSAAATGEFVKNSAVATGNFTKDVFETVTFQKNSKTPPANEAPAAPAPAAASPAPAAASTADTSAPAPATEKKTRSLSITYTVSGGIDGRVVEQWTLHTPDLMPQRPLLLDYTIDPPFASALLESLDRHGFFNWQSLNAKGADQYTAQLQVIADGLPTTVTMYGGDNNPMSELVTELRSKLRDHYIARLPKSGLCGHRGASATHPENTVAALREAVRLGVAMVEFDVARTADGQLVLMHDATVNRTTGFNGKVSELTYAQIRALDAGKWKDAKFTGEPVPTLDEALAALPRDIWLNVHLKGDAQLGAQVAAVLARHDRLHQAFLAATKEQVVAAREQTPGVMICNMSRQNDTADYITDSIAMKADFIQLLGKGKPFTADDLRRLTSANIRINYCCTDDPQLVAKLLQQGVNFVLTDNITAAQPSAPLAR